MNAQRVLGTSHFVGAHQLDAQLFVAASYAFFIIAGRNEFIRNTSQLGLLGKGTYTRGRHGANGRHINCKWIHDRYERASYETLNIACSFVGNRDKETVQFLNNFRHDLISFTSTSHRVQLVYPVLCSPWSFCSHTGIATKEEPDAAPNSPPPAFQAAEQRAQGEVEGKGVRPADSKSGADGEPQGGEPEGDAREQNGDDESQNTAGEHVGRRVEIYWPRDKAWYAGVLRSYNSDTGMYSLLYDDDDTEQARLRPGPSRLPSRRD
eukprot:1195857-Prorocentrum_minimum.AAC.3